MTATRFPDAPPQIAALPLDARGYPVPAFVPWIDGKPEFRAVYPEAAGQAHRGGFCWICGRPLPGLKAFVIGPMCAVNRIVLRAAVASGVWHVRRRGLPVPEPPDGKAEAYRGRRGRAGPDDRTQPRRDACLAHTSAIGPSANITGCCSGSGRRSAPNGMLKAARPAGTRLWPASPAALPFLAKELAHEARAGGHVQRPGDVDGPRVEACPRLGRDPAAHVRHRRGLQHLAAVGRPRLR